MHAFFPRFLVSALGAISLLLPALAHADPPAPLPKASKVAVTAKKTTAPTAPAAPRALRRIEKKDASPQPASPGGATQAREVTIEARSQGPSIVFHIEKAPVHFEMHDLGGPYAHDPAPVQADAQPKAAPVATPTPAKVEKK
jgi:hypothetical protein